MSGNSTEHRALFQDAFKKPVVTAFDTEAQSSDGGVLLLKQLDRGIGLTRKLSDCFVDDRDPLRVQHTIEELWRQRVFGIALGYSDCNDAERIGSDPCLKMACGRSPLDPESDLASQPTLSRFENSQRTRSVVSAQRGLETHVINRLAKRKRNAKRVTIDLDPSCDPAHGLQQFSLFHGFYDTRCFLPQFGFLTIDDEAEQYLFHARLRPGNVRCYRGTFRLLRRVVPQLRSRFPKATILVRLDAGFSHPRLFEILEELGVKFIIAMNGNSTLKGFSDSMMETVRMRSEASGETETEFGEASYKARSWGRSRRVVFKAEVVRHVGRKPKDNARFVVTNLRHSPKNAFAIYRERGDAENRIKELKALDSDRTSCSRFVANQLRLLMAATAFVLYQELRWRVRHTKAARAQVGRLQLMLMKIGARVVESVRRVVLHLPAAHPWAALWVAAARSVGATVP